MNRLTKLLLTSLTLLVLFACGSGGGDSETTNPPPSVYSISGTVSGDVLQGVAITLNGATSSTTTTDASGNYSFTGLLNGSYNVAPSLAGYNFNPLNTDVTINEANIANVSFSASAVVVTYDISGTVTASTGGALSDATIFLQGDNTGTTITDSIGNYSFMGLTNGSYTVTPSMTGYLFSPTNNTVSINNASSASNNFTASTMDWTLRSFGNYLWSV